MRKNLVALSVAAFVGGLGMAGGATAGVFADTTAGFVTNATAETVRQSGTGHQLVVPYYNTQSGNATLVNIVNTDTVNGKAVKVRFRGASNSDDVFDFQLFLSPGDVWTANISRGPNGVARLTTVDKSCTLPAGVGSGAGSDFVTARLPGTLTGDALATQTREGYIEIFNMADIPPVTTAGSLSKAITHVAGVPPCASMPAGMATDPTTLALAVGLGLQSPSATLLANWTIVNVPKSGSATGEAVAITATIPNPIIGSTGVVPGRGNIVFFPQTGAPATAPVTNFTADPLMRNVAGVALGDVQDGAAVPAGYAGSLPAIAASMFDLPDMSTPYITTVPIGYTGPALQSAALSLALATSSVTNEFLTDTTINAATDWTFSQPTRRYNVVADYRPLLATPALPIGRAFLTNNGGGTNGFYSAASTSVSGFQICVKTDGVKYFDREEFTAAGTSFVISPNPPAPGFSLCGEVSTLTFNAPTGSSVLGSEIAKTNFATPGTSGTVRDGWAVVSTPGLASALGVGGVSGLPIIGKSFSAASTGTFNVGGSWEHRYTPTFP